MNTTKRGHRNWTIINGLTFVVAAIVSLVTRGEIFLAFAGFLNLIGFVLNLKAYLGWRSEPPDPAL